MAHIRKLKNGTFQAAIYVGKSAELDSKGKQKKLYEYITCDTEKECKSKARELETDIENNAYSFLGKMKFDAWCEKWMLVNLLAPELAPSTIKSYKMYINYHFIPFFGHMKLKAIQEMHIKEYIAKKTKELSPNTVRKHFFLLSWIFKDALKIKSPCRDIEPPKMVKFKPEVLPEKGFSILHAALKGTWDEIPLLLASYCGMREGEIFALKWDDIDVTNGFITVDEARAISDGEGYIDKEPKSEKGKRKIAAPKIIFELIEKHRLTQKSISNYIFTMRPDSYSERFGKLIDRHNAAIKKIKSGKKCIDDYEVKFEHKRKVQFNPQKNPIPDIRFHDLRHYHATTLFENGFSDQYAADRLGHDVTVLKKIYQHNRDEIVNKENQRVKELFS